MEEERWRKVETMQSTGRQAGDLGQRGWLVESYGNKEGVGGELQEQRGSLACFYDSS